jgi:acyl carrier protein
MMKYSEFYELFKEEMEIEQDLEMNLETELSSLDKWDSMGLLVAITFIDENFQKKILLEDFKDVETIKDIVSLIGVDNFSE